MSREGAAAIFFDGIKTTKEISQFACKLQSANVNLSLRLVEDIQDIMEALETIVSDHKVVESPSEAVVFLARKCKKLNHEYFVEISGQSW